MERIKLWQVCHKVECVYVFAKNKAEAARFGWANLKEEHSLIGDYVKVGDTLWVENAELDH